MTQLEQEYQAWIAPITDKVKQAAALIGEADELAATKNKSLRELYGMLAEISGGQWTRLAGILLLGVADHMSAKRNQQ